jgi:hypothetical protein
MRHAGRARALAGSERLDGEAAYDDEQCEHEVATPWPGPKRLVSALHWLLVWRSTADDAAIRALTGIATETGPIRL